jgi:hypothetical protein
MHKKSNFVILFFPERVFMNKLFYFFVFLSFHFFSNIYSETFIVNHKCQDSFSIKGFDFHLKDNLPLSFPIELGDRLEVEDIQAIQEAGNSYRILLRLHSPEHQKSQEFISRIMNKDPFALIVKAVETARLGKIFEGNYWQPRSYEAEAAYDIYLEDGSLYKLCYYHTFEINSEASLSALNSQYLDCMVISDGDYITLGNGFFLECGNLFQDFSAEIIHQGHPLFSSCAVIGFKREPDKEIKLENDARYKFKGRWERHDTFFRAVSEFVIRFENFGRGSRPFTPIDGQEVKVTQLTFLRRESPTVFVFEDQDHREIKLTYSHHFGNCCQKRSEDWYERLNFAAKTLIATPNHT